VWTMASDGSDLRDLTNHPGSIDGEWSVAWSPDGSRLVYAVSPFQPPESSFFVRTDHAAAEALLFAVSLSIVAMLLVALGAPFGSFTVALVLIVLASVAATEQWLYLPAAVVAGLVVDLIVRVTPVGWRSEVAAAALPAAILLGIGIAVGQANALAWSLTLLLGLVAASALIGWGLAYAGARFFRLQGSAADALEHGE